MKIKRGYGAFLTCAVYVSLLALASLPSDANAQIFSQDLTVHSTETSSGMMGKGGGTTTNTDYYSRNAVKMSKSDGSDNIIQFDAEKIIAIDNKKKTYTEMTFEQLQQMLNKAGAQLGAKSEEMESVMKMMGFTDASVSVTKEGPGETIAGYTTEKYLVKLGPIEMEIMASPDFKLPGAYYDVLKIQMPPNPIFDMNQLYDEMKKIDGIPLKTVTNIKMMNMEIKSSKVVTSIEKGAVPASVFEIPSGYKRVEPQLN